MADLKQSIEFVLRQEDARLTGAITTLPGDRGGPTRFGIASRFHPDLVKSGFYELENGEPVVPHDEALAIAEKVYAEQYGAALHIDQIESQDVANRLLSFALNEGPHQALVIAQRACQSLGCALTDDGQIGPKTLEALNKVDPGDWLKANRSLQADFYVRLVNTQPNLMPLLHGLLARANA